MTAYVVNSSSGTVTPIRTATNKAGRAINVKRYPYAIAITPNGKTAYVTNTLLNTVTPIQTATRASEGDQGRGAARSSRSRQRVVRYVVR